MIANETIIAEPVEVKKKKKSLLLLFRNSIAANAKQPGYFSISPVEHLDNSLSGIIINFLQS